LFLQSNQQLAALNGHHVSSKILFRNPGNLLAPIVESRFEIATALNLLRSWDWIQTPAPVGTAIPKGMVLAVISVDHQHPLRDILLFFEAYGSVPPSELLCAGKIYDNPSAFKGPAAFIQWLLSGTYSKYTLENVPVDCCGLHDFNLLPKCLGQRIALSLADLLPSHISRT
jgi:hypothetical protein